MHAMNLMRNRRKREKNGRDTAALYDFLIINLHTQLTLAQSMKTL